MGKGWRAGKEQRQVMAGWAIGILCKMGYYPILPGGERVRDVTAFAQRDSLVKGEAEVWHAAPTSHKTKTLSQLLLSQSTQLGGSKGSQDPERLKVHATFPTHVLPGSGSQPSARTGKVGRTSIQRRGIGGPVVPGFVGPGLSPGSQLPWLAAEGREEEVALF